MQSSAFFPQRSIAHSTDSQASLPQSQADCQSYSPRTPHGLGQYSNQQQPRGLRFPSSRRFLWDKTPAGAQVLINTEEQLPHVQIAASVFSAIGRAAEQQKKDVALHLGLSVTATHQVTAVVQELDPLVAQTAADCLQLTCPLAADVAKDTPRFSRLQEAFRAQLDQRDTARLQQLYAISAAAEAACGPSGCCTLQLQLLMPSCNLLATPLYTKRLCNVPLAEALLKPDKLQSPQTGYLSMDQARSLLPLEATDVNVYSTPLVGVWVKGPSSILHPLVATACLRFVYSSLLADRAVNPENAAFLLLLCPEGDPVSKCFEVCPADPQQLQLTSYHLQASVTPSAGMTQFKNGLLSADWAHSRHQPQPILGQLRVATGSNRAGSSGLSRAAGAAGAVLALPGPSYAAAGDSPVVLGKGGPVGCRPALQSLARASAPMFSSGSSNMQREQYVEATSRRSLPLSSTGMAAASTAGRLIGVDLQFSNAAAMWGRSTEHQDSSSSAEPQPRAGFAGCPYGSPGLQSRTAAAEQQAAIIGAQRLLLQEQQGGEQEEQQQWVHLGEQLLVEPSSNEPNQQLDVPSPAQQAAQMAARSNSSSPLMHQAAAMAAGYGSNSKAWPDRQQQELCSSLEAAAATVSAAKGALDAAAGRVSPDRAAAAAAGSAPQLWIRTRQHDSDGALQQQYQQQCAAANSISAAAQPYNQQHAASSTGLGMLADSIQQGGGCTSRESSFQVHAISPVPASVQAGLALSNLALLQHLSTGQLEQAIDKVASPGKSRCSSPAQGGRVSSRPRSSPPVAGAGSVYTPPDAWPASAASHAYGSRPSTAAAAVNTAAWLNPANPQTPDAEGASMLSSSVLMGSPRTGPTRHYVPPSSSVDACRAAAATSPLRASAEAADASAALRAATAAVQRLNPNPYTSSLGSQRYAADAAVITSQECGRAGWPRSGAMVSASCVVPVSSSSSCMGYSSYNYNGLVSADGDQLDDALSRSVAAASTSAAALAAAGQMMHPYNAPSAAVGYQQLMIQQQQQLLPTVWSDPVAQALQVEVQRLREELLQLRHQLKMASMPPPDILALPPPDCVEAAQAASAPTLRDAAHAPGDAAVPSQSAAEFAMQSDPASQYACRQQQHLHSQGQLVASSSNQQPGPTTTADSDTASSDLASVQAAAANQQQAAVVPAPSAVQHQVTAGPQESNRFPAVRPAAASQATQQSQQLAVGASGTKGMASSGVESPETLQRQQPRQWHQQQQEHVSHQVVEAAHDAQQQQFEQLPAEQPGQQQQQMTSIPAEQLDQLVRVDGTNADNHQVVDREVIEPADAGETAGSFYRSSAAVVNASKSSRPSSPVVTESPVRPPGASHTTASPPKATLGALIAARQSPGIRGLVSSSVRSSLGLNGVRSSAGNVRSSLEVPPLVEVVRTKYCVLDDDSDDSDREFEERLMLKYGMKR